MQGLNVAGPAIFLLFWVTLKIAEGTPTGRFLSRVMVELPAGVLDRITRTQAFWIIAIVMLTIVALCFKDADGVRLLGLAIPDAAAWLTTFEIGTYLEMLAAVVAAAGAMRVNSSRNRHGGIIARLTRRRRRGTGRSPRSGRGGRAAPANDDEDGSAFAVAA